MCMVAGSIPVWSRFFFCSSLNMDSLPFPLSFSIIISKILDPMNCTDSIDDPTALGFSASPCCIVTTQIMEELISFNNLGHAFSRLFNDELTHDVVLKVSGMSSNSSDILEKSFFAHKIVLAAQSSFFDSLFYDGMMESKQDVIELKELNPKVFESVLKYLYTGTIDSGEASDDVDILFEMAEYLDILPLKMCCVQQSTCAVLSLAVMHGMKSTIDSCVSKISENWKDELNSEHLYDLSDQAFVALLSTPFALGSMPELEIFQAVNRWAKFQVDGFVAEGEEEEEEEGSSSSSSSTRKKKKSTAEDYREVAKGVMAHVRLPLIKVDDLANIVAPSGIASDADLAFAFVQAVGKRDVRTKCEKTTRRNKPWPPVDKDTSDPYSFLPEDAMAHFSASELMEGQLHGWRDQDNIFNDSTIKGNVECVELDDINRKVVRVHGNGCGVSFPADLNVQGEFTVILVDRYLAGGPHGRTLQTQAGNWLLGRHGGGRGSYMEGWNGGQVACPTDVFGVSVNRVEGGIPSYFFDGELKFHNVGGNRAPGRLALCTSGQYDQPSECDVGEVIIYNRALSNEEIEELSHELMEMYGI
eukprot:TRINITY_DN5072_c0_g2_i1.p1 TRINITY_DN5072_c0_g2~~TRINITY_DN5072_c0_g2_i1.p1  ORF type:complete len:586 (-),score=160.64 TRINITY_DN5072_c0_g2_i1:684-2441(-)